MLTSSIMQLTCCHRHDGAACRTASPCSRGIGSMGLGWLDATCYCHAWHGTGLPALGASRCHGGMHLSTCHRPVVLPIYERSLRLLRLCTRILGRARLVSLLPCSSQSDAFWFVLLMEDFSVGCLCLYVVCVGCVPCGLLFPAATLSYQAFASLLLMVKIEPSVPYSDFGPPIPYLK